MTVCYLFLWPLQLVCSQGMSTGVAGWVTEVSCGGWGGLEEKVFVICWRWGQRGKGARGDTAGNGAQEQKESASIQLTTLGGAALGLAGGVCWGWSLG